MTLYDDDGNIINEEGEIIENPSEEEVAAAEAAKAAEEEEEEEKEETVSLKKHLKLKAKLKEAKETSGLSQEDRELLQRVKAKEAQEALQKAYDGEFEKLAEMYPKLADKKDQLFKLVQVAGNEDKSLEEVALDTFSGFIQKVASEDGGGGGGDTDISNIDFDRMTPEQHAKVMADPKAKAKYYAYADTKN